MPPLIRQIPNAVTIGNALAGLAAVLLCFDALQQGELATGIRAAFLLITLGVLLDTLDGPLARLLKANNPMGAQLDSLCDGVTFGFATALIIGSCFWSRSQAMALLLAGWWLAAVLWRLARFNLETDTNTAHFYFHGLCSPVAALFMLALLDATLDSAIFPWLPLLAAVLLPLLMLSKLRFADLPKHYMSRQRSPAELVITALMMLVLSPSQAICIFLTYFLLQSVLANLRGKTAVPL